MDYIKYRFQGGMGYPFIWEYAGAEIILSVIPRVGGGLLYRGTWCEKIVGCWTGGWVLGVIFVEVLWNCLWAAKAKDAVGRSSFRSRGYGQAISPPEEEGPR